MRDFKNILLTFDHELFLGEKSGTPEKCLYLPYQKLRTVFQKHEVSKAIFFVDTTYLMTVKSEILNGNLSQKSWEELKDHFRQILQDGNYIFPHIHPHWLDSVLFDKNEWDLTNFSKYCFKNCSEEEKAKIWEESIAVLNEIGVEKYHSIDAFRAGGWGIQPFNEFKMFFEEYGIKYDFSVMPQMASQTTAQQFDFLNIEWKPYYYFNDSVNEQLAKGKYIEFPISVKKNEGKSFLEKVWLKYLWKSGNRSFGDGIGAVSSPLPNIEKKSIDKVEMISIELMNRLNLKEYREHLNLNSTVQFLSHPKMISNHNIKIIDEYLTYARSKFSVNYDFRKVIR